MAVLGLDGEGHSTATSSEPQRRQVRKVACGEPGLGRGRHCVRAARDPQRADAFASYLFGEELIGAVVGALALGLGRWPDGRVSNSLVCLAAPHAVARYQLCAAGVPPLGRPAAPAGPGEGLAPGSSVPD